MSQPTDKPVKHTVIQLGGSTRLASAMNIVNLQFQCLNDCIEMKKTTVFAYLYGGEVHLTTCKGPDVTAKLLQERKLSSQILNVGAEPIYEPA